MLPLVNVLLKAATVAVPLGYAMYEFKSKKNAFISDRLYCGYMSNEFTDEQVQTLCKEFKVPYPPQPSVFFKGVSNEIPL